MVITQGTASLPLVTDPRVHQIFQRNQAIVEVGKFLDRLGINLIKIDQLRLLLDLEGDSPGICDVLNHAGEVPTHG
ncbi:hypothetical protein D3C77_626400 [compost metagenome]